MQSLLQDIRYALRLLIKNPGFAAVTIVSLALGIGATTAVFSVIRAVLLDPYPYKDADRMVHVELRGKDSRSPLLAVNDSTLPDIKQLNAIDEVFTQDQRSQALTGDQFPISVASGLYSPNLFSFMGVQMLLGRGFTTMDAPNGNPTPVAVLSYLFWKKQYGANPDVLGKTIELDHVTYTVIGVAPPRFTWGDSDVYLIAGPNPDPHYYYMVFLKLKPGVTHAALAAELQPVVNHLAQQDTNNFPQHTKVAIVTLNEEVLGRFQGALIFLFSAVLLLLLIGCANVSILLLARGTARQHEFAVRSSIGAARSRLIRQLLTESVLLSLIGAGLGVLLAYRGVDIIAAYLPTFSFPHEASAGIHVNATVLIFSTALALLTGILFGISPAWQLSRPQTGPQLGQIMQAGSSRLTGKAQGQSTHRILIAGQVALTMLLLATAGTAIRGFLKLYHTPLGFDPDHVFTENITLPKNSAKTWQERANLQESLRRSASETPGVTGVSISTTWFPPLGSFRGKVELSSQPNLTDAEAGLMLVSPEIFTTLHIPLLSGRIFTEQETARAAHMALVNRAFVRQFLGGVDPIGQSVRSPAMKINPPGFVSAEDPGGWMQIIGVVDDALNDGLTRPVRPAIFVPYTLVMAPQMSLIGRAQSDPDVAIRTIGMRLHKLNPDLFTSEQHPLTWALDNFAWGNERFLASLFTVFALLALTLAAAGLYSVVSYAAARRTQELGLRMALGATRANVVRLVLGSSLTMVAVGAAAGLAISIVMAHWMGNLVGGSSRNPVTLIVVGCVLMLVAAIACAVPAWRATTINPMRALREE